MLDFELKNIKKRKAFSRSDTTKKCYCAFHYKKYYDNTDTDYREKLTDKLI